MSSEITLNVNGQVAIITLNRPEKLNAMTRAMTALLKGFVTQCNADDEIRVVILTAEGERAFCAGSDIVDLDNYATPWEWRTHTGYCEAIRSLKKPTVAAINGWTLGGGLEMSLGCDIRIASESAKFGAPEIKLGWIGGGGMSVLLAEAIGSSNAAMMLMTGDPIDAHTALNWGLVSEILPADRLRPRAIELAEAIASRAPIAAECAKSNLKAAFSMSREDAINYERDLQVICLATEDADEGRLAFKEKRSANFKKR
jgi:enoyl-CoA hydratase/carnithine racemase